VVEKARQGVEAPSKGLPVREGEGGISTGGGSSLFPVRYLSRSYRGSGVEKRSKVVGQKVL